MRVNYGVSCEFKTWLMFDFCHRCVACNIICIGSWYNKTDIGILSRNSKQERWFFFKLCVIVWMKISDDVIFCAAVFQTDLVFSSGYFQSWILFSVKPWNPNLRQQSALAPSPPFNQALPPAQTKLRRRSPWLKLTNHVQHCWGPLTPSVLWCKTPTAIHHFCERILTCWGLVTHMCVSVWFTLTVACRCTMQIKQQIWVW